jgi:hypothetical protein
MIVAYRGPLPVDNSQNFPEDLLEKIFSILSVKDLGGTVCLVNTQWNSVAHRPALWAARINMVSCKFCRIFALNNMHMVNSSRPHARMNELSFKLLEFPELERFRYERHQSQKELYKRMNGSLLSQREMARQLSDMRTHFVRFFNFLKCTFTSRF